VKHTLFISDLHLAPERPRINETFFRFLRDTAPQAEALHILGDLFENWVGDDDLADPFNASIADALAALPRAGVTLYFMQGNRDVLAGDGFAAHCGASLISDPTLIDLYGTSTLLMHGDTLCTDDVEYQKFRVYARNPGFQQRFLSQPIGERKRQMLEMRMKSEQHKQGQAAEIMDVAPATVEQTLREYGYPRLIHGHTHRPARHVHALDGRRCERWVLNDWYQRGGYLRCDGSGCEAVKL
jgi:UDP-2,3-diacylglucosamine hydrolase